MQLSNKFLKSYLQVLSENSETTTETVKDSGEYDRVLQVLKRQDKKTAKETALNIVKYYIQSGGEKDATETETQRYKASEYFLINESKTNKELIKLERYVQDVYSDLYSLDNNLDLLAKHGYTSYQDIDNMIELLSKFKNELDQLDRQMRSIYTDSRNSTNESSLNEEVDINSDSYKIGYKLAGQSGWNSRAEASTFAKSELKRKDKKFDSKEFAAGWNARKGKK